MCAEQQKGRFCFLQEGDAKCRAAKLRPLPCPEGSGVLRRCCLLPLHWRVDLGCAVQSGSASVLSDIIPRACRRGPSRCLAWIQRLLLFSRVSITDSVLPSSSADAGGGCTHPAPQSLGQQQAVTLEPPVLRVATTSVPRSRCCLITDTSRTRATANKFVDSCRVCLDGGGSKHCCSSCTEMPSPPRS